MKFNLESIMKLMSLAPVIIAGIESIHGEKDSATKQQMAQDALSLATGVAGAVLPAEQAGISGSVGGSLSSLIDSIVSIFNVTGLFQHKKPAPVPVPIAPPVVVTPDPVIPSAPAATPATDAAAQPGPGLHTVVPN